VQWTVASGGNGHWYEVVPVMGDWFAADAGAKQKTYQGMTGHLATLTSDAERVFVATNLLTKVRSAGDWGAWIGGHQNTQSSNYSEPSGGWEWVTSEPWDYAGWGGGEPNNAYTNSPALEECAVMHDANLMRLYPTYWNDGPCSASHVNGYLVEYELSQSSGFSWAIETGPGSEGEPAASVAAIFAAKPDAKSGFYKFDVDGDGSALPFGAYVDAVTAGGRWMRVRHVPANGLWYPGNDDLAGTDSLETNESIENNSTKAWSLPFSSFTNQSTEFLFMTGDRSTWCVIRRGANVFAGTMSAIELGAQVIASQGTTVTSGNYTNVLNREYVEDPWIGCEGTHSQNVPKMLYGENSHHVNSEFKEAHEGVDVFVRQPPVTAPSNETYGRFTVQLAYSGGTPVPFQAYNITNLPSLLTAWIEAGWVEGNNVASTVSVTPQTATANGTEMRLSIAPGGVFAGKTVDLVVSGPADTFLVPPWYAVWLSYSCVGDACEIRYAGTNTGPAITATWSVR
jgi:hypothetical protein